MRFVKYLLLFVFLLHIDIKLSIANQKVPQEDTLKKVLQEGMSYLYQYQFIHADSIYFFLHKTYYYHPLSYLFGANLMWWKIISGNDSPIIRKTFENNLDSALKIILNKFDKNKLSNEYVYYLINIYAYKARIELLNNNYIKAFKHINQAIEFFKKSFGKEMQFESFNLTTGMYNYLIKKVNADYYWLFPTLFFPKGTNDNGIDLIKKSSLSNDLILSTESIYFLVKIYLEQEKNFTLAKQYAEVLTIKYPENLLYQYLLFKALLNANYKEAAQTLLQKMEYCVVKNKELKENQKEHFISLAKKDMSNYSSK